MKHKELTDEQLYKLMGEVGEEFLETNLGDEAGLIPMHYLESYSKEFRSLWDFVNVIVKGHAWNTEEPFNADADYFMIMNDIPYSVDKENEKEALHAMIDPYIEEFESWCILSGYTD